MSSNIIECTCWYENIKQMLINDADKVHRIERLLTFNFTICHLIAFVLIKIILDKYWHSKSGHNDVVMRQHIVPQVTTTGETNLFKDHFETGLGARLRRDLLDRVAVMEAVDVH